MFHFFKNDIFTERVPGFTLFHPLCFISSKRHFHREGYLHPLVSNLQKRHFHREGYRLHPFFILLFHFFKTAFSPRRLPAPPLFILLFHIFKMTFSHFFTERVTGPTRFSSSCFISSKRALSQTGLPAPPLFILLFHIFKDDIFTERVTGSTPFHPLDREGYRLHPFSSSWFTSSKATFSPRGLPAPPLFILLSHIFKNGIFTKRVAGSTAFHLLVSYLQKRRFHREGYWLHPFSSSCFISSKTTFSPRGSRAPPLFILLSHIFENGIFTERVTGSTPFHPLVSYLQKRRFHREGYRLQPLFIPLVHIFRAAFSPRRLPAPPLLIFCFISSKMHFYFVSPRRLPAPPLFILYYFISPKAAFSQTGLPAPPFFILLFHIFKDDIFTERVTGSTPFHPLVSSLQKPFHRQGDRLHPFSSSVSYLQKKRFHIFSPRRLPALPLFILLFHISKNGIFTDSVTGSTPFHPLVSYLQRRHFHREGYRLHPFSSSCFKSSKTTFSPRGSPAPPLFILLFHIFKNGIFTETVAGSTPFHPFLSHIFKNGSSKTEFPLRGLTAPPLFILWFHIFKNEADCRPLFIFLFHMFKNGVFTERVTGSTPFHPFVSYLQKWHFHRKGYRLHPFSSSPLFILLFHFSKTTFSRTGLPAPPLFILLFHFFKNIQKRKFHREGYQLHPFSSSCFISSKTTFSPRGLPAPPVFLLFHIFKNGIFTETDTGSTPFHPLVSYFQKRHFHIFSPRGLPAPPLFILLFHIFKNNLFTERVPGSTSFLFLHIFTARVAGSTPFQPLVSYYQRRHFHREGHRPHPFSSSCAISPKTEFSPRGLPAPPLFILLFHIMTKTAFSPVFNERVTGSTPFHPLVSNLQKRHFHLEGYRLHPFSFCFTSSKTAFSPRRIPAPPLFILLCYIFKNGILTYFLPKGLPAPPLFILLFHIFKNNLFTERVPVSIFFILFLHIFTAGLPAPPLFSPLFHIIKHDIFTERATGPTPFHPLVPYLQKRNFHREGYRLHPFSSSCFISSKTTFSPVFNERVTGSTPFHPLVSNLQKRHFHLEGYRLHPCSSSCFISSKTEVSPRGLPPSPLFILLFHVFKNDIFTERVITAPPLFILLFDIFKNDIFTERVTGSTPFHPLVSYLQKRHFHRKGYRLHPFLSSCFIFCKTAFSPRELPAPPLFILLFHFFKNDIFTERVTSSTPFHPLASFLQKHSKTKFSPGGLPAPPLFIRLFHIFTYFHRDGYRLHPFSSLSLKTAFSPGGLLAPLLFILLFHLFKNHFTERVTGSTPFHPFVSGLQKRNFHREGYRLHPFSSSCFISSKTAFSRKGLPAPPLFTLLFHTFKNGILTERVPAPPLFILLFHIFKNDIFTYFQRDGYRLHPFSSSCFIFSKTAFSHFFT